MSIHPEVVQRSDRGGRWAPGNPDCAVALERVGGDLQLLQEIAQMFVETAPDLMHQIRAGFQAGDPKEVEHAAHTLKGCVCNFAADSVYQSTRNVEMLAHAGNLVDAAEAFRRLERSMNELIPALAEFSKR